MNDDLFWTFHIIRKTMSIYSPKIERNNLSSGVIF